MGWLMGLLGGLLEFILLREMTAAILAGRAKRILVFSLFNVLGLMGILSLVLILWRSQLAACGAVMAGTLIVCVFINFFIQRRSKKEGD